jgi:uncharacterized membrane protein YfcA
MKNIDWKAIRSGAMVALVFAVPFSIAARWIADNGDHSGAATVLSLLALIGFVLGAGIAAWVQERRLPLIHGIVCALGTYLCAQALFIAVRLAMGREVKWFAAFFNLTAVVAAGLIGGFCSWSMSAPPA